MKDYTITLEWILGFQLQKRVVRFDGKYISYGVSYEDCQEIIEWHKEDEMKRATANYRIYE
jgi:uncharacterized protein YeeX (DUF496 family)